MKPNYRRCVACRRIALKSEFWRIVKVHPTHTVALDQGMGRSAYVCRQASCLQAVQRKDRLGRALKTAIPEPIYEALWHRLLSGEAGSLPPTLSAQAHPTTSLEQP